MRHRLWWLIHLRAHGLRNGYEHPAYTPQGGTLYTLHGMQMQYKPMLHCYIDYSRVAVSVLLSCLLYTWAYLILQCLSGCVFAFIALTLLVERQKQHSACKNWMMRYQCGYMSGARCILFSYGSSGATLASFKSRLGTRTLFSRRRPSWNVFLCVCIVHSVIREDNMVGSWAAPP